MGMFTTGFATGFITFGVLLMFVVRKTLHDDDDFHGAA